MKRTVCAAFLTLAALGLAGCASAGWEPLPSGGGGEVDVTLFYDSLEPYGDWMPLEPWGWVWSPRDMPTGWRPYTWGQWIPTDLGWTWISYEPWGWAPFHYGRWTFEPALGWVWVPGRVWAPAWVAWRWGKGWVGWAPLPPYAGWNAGVGLDTDGLEVRLWHSPAAWCFVEWGRFADPGLRHHIVPQLRNAALLPLTRDVTRYEPAGGWPAERGLLLSEVEGVLGHSLTRYGLHDLEAPPGRQDRRPDGAIARVYRPQVVAAPEGATPRRTRPPRQPTGGGG